MLPHAFGRARGVVLEDDATVYEAVRAMVDNHVGAVFVRDRGRLAGIVTDRDLAVEVIGRDLDTREARLSDVMTPILETCPVDGTVEDVLCIMRQRACRRVPLVENGQLVGLVTLDDLVIEGAAAIEDVRSVVEAQLRQPARHKPEGLLHPATAVESGASSPRAARRAARAAASYHHLVEDVERRTSLGGRARAERALGLVLRLLCRRLRPDDARRLLAQLPSQVRAELEGGLVGPDKDVTLETMASELRRELDLGAGEAEEALDGVCDAIADGVSAGEIEAVRGHLPAAMKELFPPVPMPRRED